MRRGWAYLVDPRGAPGREVQLEHDDEVEVEHIKDLQLRTDGGRWDAQCRYDRVRAMCRVAAFSEVAKCPEASVPSHALPQE